MKSSGYFKKRTVHTLPILRLDRTENTAALAYVCYKNKRSTTKQKALALHQHLHGTNHEMWSAPEPRTNLWRSYWCVGAFEKQSSSSRASEKKLARIVVKRVLELCVPSVTTHIACTRIYDIASVNDIGPQKTRDPSGQKPSSI